MFRPTVVESPNWKKRMSDDGLNPNGAIEYWLPLMKANIGVSMYLKGTPSPRSKAFDDTMPADVWVTPRSTRPAAIIIEPGMNSYSPLTRNVLKLASGFRLKLSSAPALSAGMMP